jgi:hypothetical protein
MAVGLETRTHFKTGETCVVTARYEFGGYTDGSTDPMPSHREHFAQICLNQSFPNIPSSDKDCWWKLSY